MIQILLPPDKYQAALTHLEGLGMPDIEVLSLAADKMSGQIVAPQISLDFTYDGVNVNIDPTAKHGLAKFASDNTIKAHLEDLLTGV